MSRTHGPDTRDDEAGPGRRRRPRAPRRTLTPDLEGPHPSPAPHVVSPKDELRALQGGCCGACWEPLKARVVLWRDRGGTRVAGVLCFRCGHRRVEPAVRLEDIAPPLLRLRLVQGAHLSYPTDHLPFRRAYRNGDWDLLTNPAHALFVAQGGRCGMNPGDSPPLPRCQEGGRRHLVLDHDHDTGAVRGLLCYSCNTQEGKAMTSRGRVAAALLRYAVEPPAATCPPAARLPYRWISDWPRPWSSGGPTTPESLGVHGHPGRGQRPRVPLRDATGPTRYLSGPETSALAGSSASP